MRRALRYVPVGALGDAPHVMVDGAPRPGTVLTLSHWPGTPTPEPLRADLSAEIVAAALARPDVLPAGVDVATVDHYDQDAVASLALLCRPDLAARHQDRLIEVARVGDFGVVRDRHAALVSFALASLVDPRRTPLPALRGGQRPGTMIDVCAVATDAALDLLPGLLEGHGDGGAALWTDEAAAYDAATGALCDGWARIEEVPELDVAVVTVDDHPDRAAAAWDGSALHRAAVHSATDRLRIVTVAPDWAELRYRYESWVRLGAGGAGVRRRVDLTAVAAELTGLDKGGARWVFDGANAITGGLHPEPGARPGITGDRFVALVLDRLAALDAGPPAWDPYR